MRIALSLGSGGARGFAHLGVIEELEKRGHEIVGVSGALPHGRERTRSVGLDSP